MSDHAPADGSLRCFEGLSGIYAAHRPGYPDTAFDCLCAGLASPIHAADIGCGTGISTRMLAGRVAHTIGIDPNDEMLQQARAASAAAYLEFRRGRAEQTGLDDASLAVVLCAQAFHWFDMEPALREFHRILRPDGRLGLLWNVRDDDDAFTRAYSGVVHAAEQASLEAGRPVRLHRTADPTEGGLFTDARTHAWPNEQRLDLPALLGRAKSASYFPRCGPIAEQLERRLHEMFSQHARDGAVVLRYRTQLTLASPA